MGRPTRATLPPFGRPIGAYGHRLPHWPPTGHKGTGGDAFARPSPTGHLKPTWPSEAFGHLHPHAPHRAIGTPSDGRPPHPYRLAKGATRLATHWPPPTRPHPQTFGSGGQREGAGVFRVQRGRYEVGRAPYTPFGDPLALYSHLPTSLTGPTASLLPHSPHRLTN